MAQFLEYIKMAIANIKANKGRSFLTMLGIIIGISSVITILSIGQGFQTSITGEMDNLGGGQIYLYCTDEGANLGEFITNDDLDAIQEKIDNVTGLSPAMSLAGTTTTAKGVFDLSAVGGGTGQQEVSSWDVKRGRYYNERDILSASRVCVISSSNAKKIFGTDDVVGMDLEVSLNGFLVDMNIIGVVESKANGTMITMDNEDAPVGIEMPYTTLGSFGSDLDSYYAIYITTVKGSDSEKISKEATNLLNRRHNAQDKDYFMIESFADFANNISNVLNMVTAFISMVAAISLLVGGIGVMNIMLVSVTERTREIGIRKSLGAKTSSILLQFLAEAAIISGMGGVIGIILGVAVAFAVCLLPMVTFSPSVQIPVIVIATLFSCGIGVLFGVYPAKKAAKLSPIEALRSV